MLNSCSEDPVGPPPQPPPPPSGIEDSAFFNWEYREIFGYILFDIDVYDTNRIYLLTPKGFIYYDGNIFMPLSTTDTSFWGSSFKVYDPNNIFIGGQDIHIANPHSKLMKWNGTDFINIPIPEDSSKGIDNILVNNLNDVWLATDYGKKVYHYDGSNITTYNIQSRTIASQLFLNSNNELYLFGADPTGSGIGIYYVYKFTENAWNVYYSEPYDASTGIGDVATVIGNDVIRNSYNYLVKFNFLKYSWERLDTTNFPLSQISCGGSSVNDIMCYARNIHTADNVIYYYNGLKWYKQNNYTGYGYPLYRIKKKNNNFYSFYEPPYSRLIIARPKK